MRGRPVLTIVQGLLAGITAVMQLAPIYLPGAGYFLAMAATLPTAMAAALNRRRCTWFFLATSLVIGMVAVEEMLVFITTTGPLGLTLGMLSERSAWKSILASAAMLTGGMVLLPKLGGIYPWGGIEAGWAPEVIATAYGAFALAYAGLWHAFFTRVWIRIGGATPCRGGDTLCPPEAH